MSNINIIKSINNDGKMIRTSLLDFLKSEVFQKKFIYFWILKKEYLQLFYIIFIYL